MVLECFIPQDIVPDFRQAHLADRFVIVRVAKTDNEAPVKKNADDAHSRRRRPTSWPNFARRMNSPFDLQILRIAQTHTREIDGIRTTTRPRFDVANKPVTEFLTVFGRVTDGQLVEQSMTPTDSAVRKAPGSTTVGDDPPCRLEHHPGPSLPSSQRRASSAC